MSPRRFRNDRRVVLFLLAGWLALGGLVFNGVALSAHEHVQRRTPTSFSLNHASIASGEDACALCSAAAVLEPFLPSLFMFVEALLATAGTDDPVDPGDDGLAARAHSWRSRAPPFPGSN